MQWLVNIDKITLTYMFSDSFLYGTQLRFPLLPHVFHLFSDSLLQFDTILLTHFAHFFNSLRLKNN